MLAARQVHDVNSDQLLGAAHYIHFITYHDNFLKLMAKIKDYFTPQKFKVLLLVVIFYFIPSAQLKFWKIFGLGSLWHLPLSAKNIHADCIDQQLCPSNSGSNMGVLLHEIRIKDLNFAERVCVFMCVGDWVGWQRV